MTSMLTSKPMNTPPPHVLDAFEKIVFLINGSTLKQILCFQRREMGLTFEMVKLTLPSRACFKFSMHLFQKISFIADLKK